MHTPTPANIDAFNLAMIFLKVGLENIIDCSGLLLDFRGHISSAPGLLPAPCLEVVDFQVSGLKLRVLHGKYAQPRIVSQACKLCVVGPLVIFENP